MDCSCFCVELVKHIKCCIGLICMTIVLVVLIKELFKTCRYRKEIELREKELK